MNFSVINNFPWQKQHSLPFLALVGLICLLELVPSTWTGQLSFDQNAILSGAVWQMVTGHLVHSNLNHLLLNLAGLLAIWALHGDYYRWRSLTILTLVSAVLNSFMLIGLSPIEHYVGLSGVIHSYFAWGCIQDIQRKEKTGWLLLVGLIGKIIHEQLTGGSLDVAELIETSVAIDSHLFGVLSGLLCAAVMFISTKVKKS